MDLNLVTSAQLASSNQIRFDQAAFDQAILRAEKRREFAQKLLASLCVQLRAIGEIRAVNADMATRKRFG